MASLTITNKIFDKYFGFLKRFDNKTKKKLIIQLTRSLELKETGEKDIASLFGAWKDDKSADEIIEEIRKSRVEPKDKTI